VTPLQQRGGCASAKVKRWHDKATFLPSKHNLTSMQLCQAACVCVRVHACVCMCACVCVCKLAHAYQPSAIGPMYCPTRHQVGVRWRMRVWSRCKHVVSTMSRACIGIAHSLPPFIAVSATGMHLIYFLFQMS